MNMISEAYFARISDDLDEQMARARQSLYTEYLDALMQDPQRMVRTPAFGKHQQAMSAVDLFFDALAGRDADAQQHAIVRLLADAAKGEDIQLRATLLLQTCAKAFAEWHAEDAVMGEQA
jgi:hypothetical protein